mmetsp:Transcript_7507/g.9789  ORF Transcript_7507/g.9789 Transcript_7507/m.9789 type:complete len:260 (+) Transcript_7507:249-1028(+)
MTVGSSLVVLGFSQAQGLCQSTRTAIKVDLDNVSNKLGSQTLLFGSVCFDEQTEGLGNTNGVRQLDTSTFAKSSLDDRFCHPTACVGCRTIDLGRVLSGEGTTTMGTPSSVGIDNNLTTSQTGITLGTTNDELSRWVDVQVACGTVVDRERTVTALKLDGLEGGLDDVFVNEFIHFLHGRGNNICAFIFATVVFAVLFSRTRGFEWFSMLCGDDNGVDLDRCDRTVTVLGVFNGDLSLSIGAQPPQGTVLADIRQFLSE